MQKVPSADNQNPATDCIARPIEVHWQEDGVLGQDRVPVAHRVSSAPFPQLQNCQQTQTAKLAIAQYNIHDAAAFLDHSKEEKYMSIRRLWLSLSILAMLSSCVAPTALPTTAIDTQPPDAEAVQSHTATSVPPSSSSTTPLPPAPTPTSTHAPQPPTAHPTPTRSAEPQVFALSGLANSLPQALYVLAGPHPTRDTSQVYRISPDGSLMRQVTFNSGRIEDFDVSASGDLAYSLFDSRGSSKVLKVIAADGSPARVIDSVPPDPYACGDIASPLFSPDGRTLAYNREEKDPATNRCVDQLIFLDLITDTRQVVLDSRNELDLSITTPRTQKRLASMSYMRIWSPYEWSADSRYLTVSDTEIWYVVDREAGGLRTGAVAGWDAELSPDGALLFVGGVIHDPFETQTCSSYEGLTRIEFEVSKAERMLWCNYDTYALRLDPTTSVLYFLRTQQPNARPEEFTDLMRISMNPPFREPEPIRSTALRMTHLNDSNPGLWAPDGSRVVFHTYSQGGEHGSLVVLPIQRHDPVELLVMPLVVSEGLRWGPVGPED